MYVTEIPKEVRDKRTEKIAEELLAEKFPKLMKALNPHIEKLNQLMHKKYENYTRHIINTLIQTSNNKNCQKEKRHIAHQPLSPSVP